MCRGGVSKPANITRRLVVTWLRKTAQLGGALPGYPGFRDDRVFEDVHWVDPTSLEALSRTVDRLRTRRVLLIVTYRPEFEPPWMGLPYVTALNLNRLGEREIAAMIDRVTGNKALPESIRQDIIERTDGIPLFVEEMTKAVLEAETEGEATRTASAVPSSALAVPASLHASLMARLDRLGSAKEVAQIGAAIGREFTHPLLAAVAYKAEPEIQSALDRLIKAGLLFRQGLPPQAAYLFKHALIQDAAYSTMLRGPRRLLHARIAETLASKFADIAENQPELLAHHFTQADLTNAAIEWSGKAGEKALRRSAFEEAISHLGKAIEMADTAGDGSVTSPSQRLKLQTSYGQALMLSRGFGSEESKAAFTRAQWPSPGRTKTLPPGFRRAGRRSSRALDRSGLQTNHRDIQTRRAALPDWFLQQSSLSLLVASPAHRRPLLLQGRPIITVGEFIGLRGGRNRARRLCTVFCLGVHIQRGCNQVMSGVSEA